MIPSVLTADTTYCPTMASDNSIPITVFTGFLGAGKTSVILSLLPKLPPGYKAVLLKNEYGDIEGTLKFGLGFGDYVSDAPTVDSKLANESSLSGVSEILNGCM